jgi:hypothetical protein
MAVSASVGRMDVVSSQELPSLTGHDGVGGVVQDYTSAGCGAEVFRNREDCDSRVSWDPMVDPSEKEPVFSRGALPSSVGSKTDRMALQWWNESLLLNQSLHGSPSRQLPSQDTLPMRHAQSESARSGELLTRHSLHNLLQAGWGRDEMHHDTELEHGSSNAKPREQNQESVKYVTSATRQQSPPRRPSQLASALKRPLLLSHSQQLKRHGGRDAETAVQTALEYCQREIHVPGCRGLGNGAAAEDGSNMVQEERGYFRREGGGRGGGVGVDGHLQTLHH